MKKSSISLPESTDEEIIKKILTGHTVWFELLVRRYNSVLYKIARGYGFNQQDAEDLIQDAHYTAFIQLKDLKNPTSYKTWVSKILINNCIYKLAHGYFKYETPKKIKEKDTPIYQKGEKDSTENIISNRELSVIIESCLRNIPIIYKSVFILREIEGFNVAETSEILGITHVNVKVRLSRAKSLLRNELEKYYSVKDVYDFKDIYCNEIVNNVFERISVEINRNK